MLSTVLLNWCAVFWKKILAPKQERTMNVPQKNRKRGQDMEL